MTIKFRALLVAVAVVVVAAVVGLSSTPARAGAKGEWPVYIKFMSGGTGFVWGALGSVRANAGDVEYMYVEITGVPGDLSVYAEGRNAIGTTRACSSTDPSIIQAAQSISGDSFVVFHYDAEGNCTKLAVENGSNLRPKTL